MEFLIVPFLSKENVLHQYIRKFFVTHSIILSSSFYNRDSRDIRPIEEDTILLKSYSYLCK